MSDVAPEDYTWSMAAKDLALMTPLTLRESTDIVRAFEVHAFENIRPYDLLPLLIRLVTVNNGSQGGLVCQIIHLARGTKP